MSKKWKDMSDEERKALIDSFAERMTMGFEFPEDAKEFNLFRCESCDGKPEFNGSNALVKHMKEAHSIPERSEISSKMIMHLDGTDWFQTNSELTFHGGTIASQICRCRRSARDKEF